MSQQDGAGQLDSDLASEGGLNTGKMVPACWLHGRRALHREDGDCISNPCLEVTRLSLSPYVSDAPTVTVRALGPRMSTCLGHLRAHLGFPQPSVPPRQNPRCFS